MKKVFGHAGDLGDLIAALPTIRHLGGGDLILGDRKGHGTREPMSEARFANIAPLLEGQLYIASVRHEHNAKAVTHDFSDFRTRTPKDNYTLPTWQADKFGISATVLDLSPWLTVTPNHETNGRTVVSRTARYHNEALDWKIVVECNPNAVFIGTQDEHKDFVLHFGKIERIHTDDLLHVAQLIAGSARFIGNQSCPCWIAMAMGHPLVQEVCLYASDSIIKRDNAIFVRTDDDLRAACGLPPKTAQLQSSEASEHFVLFGTGHKPQGFELFERGSDWKQLIQLHGYVRIHLHAAWWGSVSPQRLQVVLDHFSRTGVKFEVTVGP